MLNRRLTFCVTDIVCVCCVGCPSLAHVYQVPCRYLLRVNIESLILTVPLGGPYFEQYIIFYVCVYKFAIV